jgi:hypothetical protein
MKIRNNNPNNRIAEPITRNKVRDKKILKLWCSGYYTMEQIGKHFKLSAARIDQIIYRNAHLIEFNKNYEKIKRINRLNNLAKQYGDEPLSEKRDILDIHKELRAELEGDSGNTSTAVTVVMGQITLNNKPLEYDIGERD